MIALALMMCVIVSIVALSSVQLTNSIFSSLNANQVALQAQQYAESKAELIKNTDYKNLTAQEKKNIPGTIFFDEVTIEAETDVPDQTNIKQKIVNIKVYKNNESLPRINLAVPRTTAGATAAGVPIGTIIAWASHKLPTDSGVWLICNGQSTAAYPKLAEIVGSNVPNYQGIFLRGYGSQMSSHYGNINHTSDNLGILQGDSIREISGTFGELTSEYGNFTSSGTFKRIGSSGGRAAAGRDSYGTWIDFYASRVSPVTNEIRPVNRAVHWLIKAA